MQVRMQSRARVRAGTPYHAPVTLLLDVEAVTVAQPLLTRHLPEPKRRHRIGRRSGSFGAKIVEARRRVLRGIIGGDSREAEPRGVLRSCQLVARR